MRWPHGLSDELCYGGDYNPEQWPEEVWAADIALMREAGVNLVTVGVFAWSRLEPREGGYDFGWLDRVLDQLHAGGVRVALATPTAAPPPWFSFAHPEALTVTADGVHLSHGSRDTYCASAPAYRAAAVRIATELGRRYGEHPALALWHVHNEYGTGCYCDLVAAQFREWLRGRYGDLEHLNDAWTGAFWSQYYADWRHILPPRATQYLANPTQVLDFRRFMSDELLNRFREQRDILRALTPEVPITTNFVLGGWVPVEHRVWADEVDVVAIDHYPSSAEPLRAEEETAFAADLARGWARGRPWLLMEQAPNLIYSGGRMLAKEPGRMARLSLSHVARGSRGSMFFQWRAPRGGAERFHSAMVPHAGPRTRVFAEVVELGSVLRRLGGLPGAITAQVAVVWDAPSWWALQGPGLPVPDLGYDTWVREVHAALWRAGVTVDVIGPESDLTPYRLVLVPCLYLLSDDAAGAMRSYVEAGGSLVAWFLTGTADVDNRVRLDGRGALSDTLGVRVEEFHPTAEVALSDGDKGRVWSELVRLDGAEAVTRYASGVLDGEPAVTRNRVGAGTTWYVSTWLRPDRLLEGILTQVGVAVSGAVAGVEVVRRGGCLFVINHTDQVQEIAAEGKDLIRDRLVDGVLRLAAGEFAVLEDT